MKAIFLLGSLAMVLASCASTPNISEMKSVSQQDAEKVYTAAKKGDSKFLFNEFSKSYKGTNKVKKIGILYYSIGWDYPNDFKNDVKIMTPKNHFADYEKTVNDSMAEMIETFKKLGYEVVTPTELAAMSATYKGLKENAGVTEVSPNYGLNFLHVAVKDSRYIDKVTHAGKLLSKINEEAPTVDAFIGFSMNAYGNSGTKWTLDDTKFFAVNGANEAHSFLCVSREKAKKNGVKLGLFGDANDCARAQAMFKASIYTPSTDSEGSKHFADIKELGFSNMSLMYRNVARGLVENYYEEGLKE